MKVKTFNDLIDWTRALHALLAECLGHCARETDDSMASSLMTYLSEHEARLSKAIDSFEHRADPKALNTMVYDYLEHPPLNPHTACNQDFGHMGFDKICAAVFDLHNEAIDLFRYLLSRADIPEARELLEELLEMEEHETRLLSHQANRMHDL